MSGIQDVVGKSIGSATLQSDKSSFCCITSQQTPKDISLVRGKKIKDIVSRR